MPAARHQQNRRPSFIAYILSWCGRYARAIAPAAASRFIATQSSDVVEDRGASGGIPELPRHSYDASLLFRRMAALQIDRDELASDDPLLFRELQGLCALCRDKERCVLELAQESDGTGNQSWREYCPNDATLNALAAVQNCPRAAQYLRRPRSTGHLANERLPPGTPM
jgi:hypothetical protein